MKHPPQNGSTLPWAIGIPTVIFGGLLLLLGWMGLIPGLSDLMGTRVPTDLGIVYSPADLESLKAHYVKGLNLPEASQEQGPESTPPPAKPTIEIPPSVKRGASTLQISEQELSALANQPALKLLPLNKVQVRLSPQTLELSGVLDQSSMNGFLKNIGIRESDARQVRLAIDALGDNLPVYLRLEGGVDQGQLNFHLDEVQLGNLQLPEALTNQISKGTIKGNTANRPGYSIEQLSIGQGTMEFRGSAPTQWGLSP